MLLALGSVITYTGMAVCFWLAAYLLARGFRSPVTMRGVVVLFAVAVWYWTAFDSLFETVPNFTVRSAILVTIGLVAWGAQTFQLHSAVDKRRFMWMNWTAYGLGFLRIALLAGLAATRADANTLRLDPLWSSVPLALADSLDVGLIVAAILFNFWRSASYGIGAHSRLAWAGTLVALGVIAYGLLPVILNVPLPGLVQPAGFLASIGFLSLLIGVRKIMVERRTTSTDFAIAGLAIFGLTTVYVLAAWRRGLSPVDIAIITVLSILTLSTYDLVREWLERLLRRQEGVLRRQLRWLARDLGDEQSLQFTLQRGLEVICRSLKASNGFIAIRRGEHFLVTASVDFLPLDTALDAESVACDDVSRPNPGPAESMAWLAPAASGEWVGVVGLGQRTTRIDYATADLDWLADFADWVGQMVATDALQQAGRQHLTEVAAEVHSREVELRSAPEALIESLVNEPDFSYVRLVEEGLRHMADYSALGELPLAAVLEITGSTTIERGKALRAQMQRAIEGLRPGSQQPKEPLPREWHNYAILYGAYIEDVPNRELMARLYISEGTFHRQRRKALKAVARSLSEMTPAGAAAPQIAGPAAKRA